MKDNDTLMQYIAWENKAFEYYLSARSLYYYEIYSPTAFCAHHTIELWLKAILFYWVNPFNPMSFGHTLRRLYRHVKNQVPNGKKLNIPNYFYHNQLYLIKRKISCRGIYDSTIFY